MTDTLFHVQNASGRRLIALASGVVAAIILAVSSSPAQAAPVNKGKPGGRTDVMKAQGNLKWGADPSSWGEWIADVERPSVQFRGRYQSGLSEARRLRVG